MKVPQFTLLQAFAVVTAACVYLVAVMGGFGPLTRAATIAMSVVVAIALMRLFMEVTIEFLVYIVLPAIGRLLTLPWRSIRGEASAVEYTSDHMDLR